MLLCFQLNADSEKGKGFNFILKYFKVTCNINFEILVEIIRPRRHAKTKNFKLLCIVTFISTVNLITYLTENLKCHFISFHLVSENLHLNIFIALLKWFE